MPDGQGLRHLVRAHQPRRRRRLLRHPSVGRGQHVRPGRSAAVDGPPTRDKVLAKLQGLTSYDADGIIAPINPAEKQGASCFLIAKVDSGKWFRTHPDKPGFDCKQWCTLHGRARRARRSRFAGVALVPGGLHAAFVFSQARSPADFLQFTMIGIALGAVYAISAAGLVLTYTTTGVFNFAHGAVGMFAAYLYFQLRVHRGLAHPGGPARRGRVGGSRRRSAPRAGDAHVQGSRSGTTLTVTIALTILLIGLAQTLFPDDQAARVVPSFFGSGPHRRDLRGAPALGPTLRHGRGRGGRRSCSATSSTCPAPASPCAPSSTTPTSPPSTAPTRSSSPGSAWVLGSVLAALAGVLVAPQQGALQAAIFAFTVITAYGAAVVARLSSLTAHVRRRHRPGRAAELGHPASCWSSPTP